MNNKYSLWIESEKCENGWVIYDDNTDVIVEFESGDRWVASFFTYSNINKLTKKNKLTGENLYGKYFWSSDMILIDEISRERLLEVINHLISNGDFIFIFKRLD